MEIFLVLVSGLNTEKIQFSTYDVKKVVFSSARFVMLYCAERSMKNARFSPSGLFGITEAFIEAYGIRMSGSREEICPQTYASPTGGATTVGMDMANRLTSTKRDRKVYNLFLN